MALRKKKKKGGGCYSVVLNGVDRCELSFFLKFKVILITLLMQTPFGMQDIDLQKLSRAQCTFWYNDR